MTPEQIHDALTLLPSDLIAEVDEKRNRKPKVIPLKRYAAMAASFVLVLCSGLYCLQLFGSMGASKETASLPTLAHQENSLYAEAAPEAPAAQAAPREDICGVPTAPASEENAGASGNLSNDHAHTPREPMEEDGPLMKGTWCGNMTATVYLGEEAHTLSGADAVTLTDILYYLDYDPDALCSCPVEFTVDTEMNQGYEINLTEYFVRYEGRQAALTPEQAEAIHQILENIGG